MRYVKTFKDNNSPPYICHFCNEEVAKLVVHHLDHDRSNGSPENLVATHKLCHDRHHLVGRDVTWGDKISAKKKVQWEEGVYDNKRPSTPVHSEETKRKISAALKGRKNPKHSDKMKQAWARGVYSDRKSRSKA